MNTFKFSFLLLIGAFLFGCGKDAPKPDPAILPERVVINFPDSNMAIGSVATVSATVYPENTTDKTLEWSSTDPSVVSVDANGRIEALKEGQAMINAATKTGRIVNSSITVWVASDKDRVSGWLEYVTIPNRSFTAIEVYLSNASNKPLKVKQVEVYDQYEAWTTAPPGSVKESVTARSTANLLHVHDSYSSFYDWFYVKVYFVMNERTYAMKIRSGSFETETVEQINVGSDTEWDGDDTIEIP